MMKESRPLFLEIRSLIPSLNPALRKIAEYIISNPNKIKYLRIKDLASECRVAEATVTRFVRTIGFNSYQAFKISIAELTTESLEKKEFVYDEVTRNDNIDNLVYKIIAINTKALEDTYKILNVKEIQKAINIIDSANKIDIYGAGGSFISAENARMRFYRIGKRCMVYNDPNQEMVSASLLTGNDLAIGISNSGRTISTVNALKLAKESGAKTICITNFDKTPLAEYADIKLFTSTCDSAFFQESMISRVAQIVLIDILYAGLAIKNFDKSIKLIEKSAKALKNALL